jgi:hypothetical protein
MAPITKHSKIGCIRKGTKEIKSCEHCPRTFMGSKNITILIFQYPTPPKYNISIGVIIILFHILIFYSLHMNIYITSMVVLFDML